MKKVGQWVFLAIPDNTFWVMVMIYMFYVICIFYWFVFYGFHVIYVWSLIIFLGHWLFLGHWVFLGPWLLLTTPHAMGLGHGDALRYLRDLRDLRGLTCFTCGVWFEECASRGEGLNQQTLARDAFFRECDSPCCVFCVAPKSTTSKFNKLNSK